MALAVWSAAEDDEGDALFARAYGSGLGDLVVDFEQSINTVITGLLQTCLSAPDGVAFTDAEVAHWTIAKRRQGLLAVAVATNGPMRLMTANCTACGDKLALDVELANFQHDWRIEELAFGEAHLRLPRPMDLVEIGDDVTRLAHVLLVGDPPVGIEAWETKAEATLEAADPLADLQLQAACPECGAEVAMPLVLETYLIEELARGAIRLMDEIHVLALAYHWTEPEVIALPENRRRHYLARIREAWAA